MYNFKDKQAEFKNLQSLQVLLRFIDITTKLEIILIKINNDEE